MPTIVRYSIKNRLRDGHLSQRDASAFVEAAQRSNAGPLDESVATLSDLAARSRDPQALFLADPTATAAIDAFVSANGGTPPAIQPGWDRPLGDVHFVPTVHRSPGLGVKIDVAPLTQPRDLAWSDAAVIRSFSATALPRVSGALYGLLPTQFGAFLDRLADGHQLKDMSAPQQAAWLRVYARAAELDRDGVAPLGCTLTVPQWWGIGRTREQQLTRIFEGRAWSQLKRTPEVADALNRVMRALDESTTNLVADACAKRAR